MQLWSEIRRRVLAGEISLRQACSEYGLNFRTVRKIVRHAEPPPFRAPPPRRKPVLGPFLAVIQQITMVRCGAGSNIELFKYTAPDQKDMTPKNSDIGGMHIALYVDDVQAAKTYLDSKGVKTLKGPIPIGEGQTISQPLIVGLMTQALEVTDRTKVLEIGTSEHGTDDQPVVRLCWLADGSDDSVSNRVRADICASYHFVSAEPETLLATQDRFSLFPNASFDLADISMAGTILPGDGDYDLAIVNFDATQVASGVGLSNMLKE